MKGHIDGEGCLVINRSGVERDQNCPFAAEVVIKGEQGQCRDWCPHFGEPVAIGFRTQLEICNGKTLVFDDFEDHRGK